MGPVLPPPLLHLTPQNTSSVNQISKTASMVHTLEDHGIYGTYIVPPVAEGLKMVFGEAKANANLHKKKKNLSGNSATI